MFLGFDSIIRDYLDESAITIDANIVTTDYELGLLKAVEWYWAKADRHGCYVHFLRCQINQLRVEEQGTDQKLDQKKVTEKFKNYFKYFEDTWIQGAFPIKLWNIQTLKLQRHSTITIIKSAIAEFIEGIKYTEARAKFGLNSYKGEVIIHLICRIQKQLVTNKILNDIQELEDFVKQEESLIQPLFECQKKKKKSLKIWQRIVTLFGMSKV